MGSSLEELAQAGGAHVNLVVSSTGLGAAKALQELFGTPYVVGLPIGKTQKEHLREALHTAASTGENQFPVSDLPGEDILVIGEAVTSLALASALEYSAGRGVRVLCPTEGSEGLLRSGDLRAPYEEEIEAAMREAKTVIADPLYRPICPDHVKFVELPTEAFSGRIYRERIPNLVTGFDTFAKEVL